MLVKDFIKEFKNSFQKVVGKVAVPGGLDRVVITACQYPLVGSGLHVKQGLLVAPIESKYLEGYTLVPIFNIHIAYTFHEPSQCSRIEGVSLEPSEYVEDITDYKNLTTKELINNIETEIVREKLEMLRR